MQRSHHCLYVPEEPRAYYFSNYVMHKINNKLGTNKCQACQLSLSSMAFRFMRESLPPCLLDEESKRSIHSSGASWNDVSKSVENVEKVIASDTQLRLVRRHCVRLTRDEQAGTHRLYFSVENTRVYHQVELQSLELENDDAKNMKFIMSKYPKYCCADDLKFGEEDSKLELMMGLYEKGILVTGTVL